MSAGDFHVFHEENLMIKDITHGNDELVYLRTYVGSDALHREYSWNRAKERWGMVLVKEAYTDGGLSFKIIWSSEAQKYIPPCKRIMKELLRVIKEAQREQDTPETVEVSNADIG